MPQFAYEALDQGGKMVKGVIDAPNDEIIAERLRDMGFYPLKISQSKVKAGEFDVLALPGIRHIFHRVTFKHITTFTRQLATLIDAGLPILRSLHILQEQVESAIFKEKIAQMAKDIESGTTLSEAFGKHPKQFDSLYVNMVRAGEIGGVLESVLNKIAEFLEKRAAIISKVKSAMMYPLVVMVVAGLISSGILIFIMPRFQDIFNELGATLPWLTLQLIHASEILRYQTWKVGVVIVLLVFGFKYAYKNKTGRFVIDSMKLKIPVFGALFQKAAIVRFAGTLATLITSGVPILQALDIVRETSGNEVITRAMDGVYNSVKEGESIHEPLRQAKVFPPLVVHMVAVGEETGAIDHMLQKVSEAYEREVEATVDALTSILEPILIVFLGAIVGTIVIALYLPLFDLPKHVGND
ncbi:type II secretion system F family protein [Candidatus Sumerlaeota bacterium]|nr:type II secretion system F family protein [Candidatus Sumerlaeota bacterium]